MAVYTNSLSQIALAYKTIVDGWASTNNIEDVFYGNQVKFPKTPAVVIEPDEKRAEITRAPRGTTNFMLVNILIIHMRVQDNQINRLEADALAESLEATIHDKANLTLGGLAVHQYVRRMQSGFVNRENSQFMSTLLTAEAETLFFLPDAFS